MCGLIAACAFAIACTPLTGPEFAGVPGLWATEFKTALYALIAAAVVAPVAFQPLLAGHAAGMLSARLLGSRPVRFLGKISYGIFLWQFLAAYAFFGLLHLQDRVRRGLLHHARGRCHRGGDRPAHDRRRHRELLPDRAPGPAPADVRAAGALAGLRQDLAPGR